MVLISMGLAFGRFVGPLFIKDTKKPFVDAQKIVTLGTYFCAPFVGFFWENMFFLLSYPFLPPTQKKISSPRNACAAPGSRTLAPSSFVKKSAKNTAWYRNCKHMLERAPSGIARNSLCAFSKNIRKSEYPYHGPSV
jgi:hypothetical protein